MVGQWIKKITPTLAKNLKAGRSGQFCLRVTSHLTLRSDLTLSMGPMELTNFTEILKTFATYPMSIAKSASIVKVILIQILKYVRDYL